ncbi:hypothetical protein ACRRTK_015332 [Alexandromys fortis]
MNFNCILEFFSLLYFKERKRRKRNQSERERGVKEVFIWVKPEAQSILPQGDKISHTGKPCVGHLISRATVPTQVSH